MSSKKTRATKNSKPTAQQRPRGSASRNQENPRPVSSRKKPVKKQQGVLIVFGNAIKAVLINILSFFKADKTRLKALAVVLGVLIITGGILLSVYLLNVGNAYAVTVDGEQVAVIKKDKDDITEELTKQAIMKIENRLGTKISVLSDVKYELVHASKKDISTPDDTIIKLSQSISYKVEGYAITVEGTTMVILSSKSQAESILQSIIEPYLLDGVKIVDSGFVEEVNVESRFVDSDELTDMDKALQILTSTLETAEEYTVVSGDNLYLIATKNGMSIDKILSLNPGMDINTTLHIGDRLSLTVDKPLLSVITIEEKTYTDVEPKPIQYVQIPNEKTTYQRTVQYGSVGQAEVISHIKRINGMEISTETVDRKITVDPVPEIIEVGTKQ